MMKPSKRAQSDLIKNKSELPGVRSRIMGGQVFLDGDDFRVKVLGVDLAKEPEDRPRLLSKQTAAKLADISVRTVDRIIERGRQSAEHAA